MLVLSRKKGEKIMVGLDITIEVVEIKGRNVRLGIVVPKEVLVLREELVEPEPEPDKENVVE